MSRGQTASSGGRAERSRSPPRRIRPGGFARARPARQSRRRWSSGKHQSAPRPLPLRRGFAGGGPTNGWLPASPAGGNRHFGGMWRGRVGRWASGAGPVAGTRPDGYRAAAAWWGGQQPGEPSDPARSLQGQSRGQSRGCVWGSEEEAFPSALVHCGQYLERIRTASLAKQAVIVIFSHYYCWIRDKIEIHEG